MGAGTQLRKLMADHMVVLPGVFNAISAQLAEQKGAEAIYLSGAGLVNGMLGAPDIGLLSLGEVAWLAGYITQAVHIPAILDADTGFGESVNIRRAVPLFERAGLAGIHIEDQVFPKRCGHLEGKQVISPQAMLEKIKAATDARTDPDFLIIARTDARAVEGLQAAIERANLYAQAGADAIFTEALENEDEFRRFAQECPVPLLANMTEFGKTPILPASFFREAGYRLLIYPMTAFRMMMTAVSKTYQTLLEEGTQTALLPEMTTRQQLYQVIGYDRWTAADEQAAQEAQALWEHHLSEQA